MGPTATTTTAAAAAEAAATTTTLIYDHLQVFLMLLALYQDMIGRVPPNNNNNFATCRPRCSR